MTSEPDTPPVDEPPEGPEVPAEPEDGPDVAENVQIPKPRMYRLCWWTTNLALGLVLSGLAYLPLGAAVEYAIELGFAKIRVSGITLFVVLVFVAPFAPPAGARYAPFVDWVTLQWVGGVLQLFALAYWIRQRRDLFTRWCVIGLLLCTPALVLLSLHVNDLRAIRASSFKVDHDRLIDLSRRVQGIWVRATKYVSENSVMSGGEGVAREIHALRTEIDQCMDSAAVASLASSAPWGELVELEALLTQLLHASAEDPSASGPLVCSRVAHAALTGIDERGPIVRLLVARMLLSGARGVSSTPNAPATRKALDVLEPWPEHLPGHYETGDRVRCSRANAQGVANLYLFHLALDQPASEQQEATLCTLLSAICDAYDESSRLAHANNLDIGILRTENNYTDLKILLVDLKLGGRDLSAFASCVESPTMRNFLHDLATQGTPELLEDLLDDLTGKFVSLSRPEALITLAQIECLLARSLAPEQEGLGTNGGTSGTAEADALRERRRQHLLNALGRLDVATLVLGYVSPLSAPKKHQLGALIDIEPDIRARFEAMVERLR